MKKRGGRILWLVYIDSTIPKSRGRIVPRGQAVSKPTVDEVRRALETLNYQYQFFSKKYPALWFDERAQGYFVVKTDERIKQLALKVAQVVKTLRG